MGWGGGRCLGMLAHIRNIFCGSCSGFHPGHLLSLGKKAQVPSETQASSLSSRTWKYRHCRSEDSMAQSQSDHWTRCQSPCGKWMTLFYLTCCETPIILFEFTVYHECFAIIFECQHLPLIHHSIYCTSAGLSNFHFFHTQAFKEQKGFTFLFKITMLADVWKMLKYAKVPLGWVREDLLRISYSYL